VPALYGDIHASERNLPQHNVSFSEVEGVKYLAFPPYAIYDFAPRLARIPLNAFISGPTAGRSISRSSSHDTPPPRAVHTRFWYSICPRENRRVLNAAEMPHLLVSHDSATIRQSSLASSSASSQEGVYAALLAVHLRRGGFVRHCARLAEWGVYFTGFNLLKELSDPWIPFNSSSHDEEKEYYRKRCYPTYEEIMEIEFALKLTPSNPRSQPPKLR
ncbi:hypothetical protein AN958_01597, partial [Leucoagaricus sp. SymC.cos]